MTLLEIFIFRGEQFLGSRVFTDSSISIGRGSSALLRLDDRQISRLHATIVVDGARLLIRDEGSAVGTKVNGEAVRERTFREVDTLEIGGFRLKVARRSMKGTDDFERDEPTETGLRAADLRRRIEAAEASEQTPLPNPSPLGGPDLSASGVRFAQPVMQGGAVILSVEPGAKEPAPAAPTPAAKISAQSPATPAPQGPAPSQAATSQAAPSQAAAPSQTAAPSQPAAAPPADAARAAGSSLPTQRLDLISAAAVPPPSAVPPAPVVVRTAPSRPDSSVDELTAGVEDSSTWALRQHAIAAQVAAAQAAAGVPAAASPLSSGAVPAQGAASPLASGPVPVAAAGHQPAASPLGSGAVPAVSAVAADGPAVGDAPADPAPASFAAPPGGLLQPGHGGLGFGDATPLLPLRAVESAGLSPSLEDAFGIGEDDEEDDFVPSFSLLDLLDKDPLTGASQDGAALRLEIIHHRQGQVVDVQQLPRRRNFPAAGRRLVRFDADGRAQLAITEDVSGHVSLNGRAIPLEEIRRGARDRKGVALLEMREGDHAEVIVSQPSPGGPPSQSHYHIRFVRLPQVAADRRRSGAAFLSALGNGYLFGAMGFHALVFFLISLIPSAEGGTTAEEPRFAEVSMKQIQLEPPPEVKPPEPEPPAPKTPEITAAPVKTRVRTPRVRSARQPQASALAALEMLKPAATASQSLKDVVSNINAVSVPADARSRFKVGGAIGKLPIGDVRVSTAGAARDTASGRELLSKENVGALKGAGGSGNVRGVVKQAPPAALQAAGSGRLSRAQIQKVINEHVAQVQACYEKSLLRDHSLAGKITFDWVIAENGSVSSVRVRASTMSGSAVSTCILQEIRSWTFPTPEGGSVAVTYPFIFSAQGF